MRGIFFKQIISYLLLLLLLLTAGISTGLASVAEKYSGNVIVYYDFDQLKGKVIQDNSGRGNNARISNSKNFWGGRGVFGGAGNFTDGTKVILGNTKRLGRGSELTIMMWVKPKGLSGRRKLLSKRSYDDEFNYYMIGIDKGKPFAGLADGDNFAATPKTKTIIDGDWQHIAMILKDDNLKLFVNGKLFEELSLEQDGYNTSSNISIGSDFEGAQSYFEGFMDELIILNKALKDTEIKKEVDRSKVLLLKNVTPDIIRKNPSRFLAASFPINEGRGKNVKCDIDVNHFGVLSDGLQSGWREGFLKSSLFFNGQNNHIRFNHNNNIDLTESFSILCWVKPEKVGEKRFFIYKGNPKNNNQFYSFGEDNGSLLGGFGNGKKASFIYKADILKLREWQQACLLFDHKKKIIKLFYNGKIIDQKMVEIMPFSGKTPMYIAGHPDIKKSFFEGELAKLQIYNVCLPDEVILKMYQENKNILLKIHKKREKQILIRNELKKALRELNELNELLGEEEKIREIRGKEAETLEQVKALIKKKLNTLKTRKKAELEKLKVLIQKRDLSSGKLNSILGKLKQPAYQSKKIEVSEKSEIKDIIQFRAELKREVVEINLLIREKEKEVELKEDFVRRKKERLQKKINSDLEILNAIRVKISKPEVSLDKAKFKSDPENYVKEIVSLINQAENERKQIILKLKSSIVKYRDEIPKIHKKLKNLSEILNQPVPKEIDISSPLIDNIIRLSRINEYEEKIIKDWLKLLKQYEGMAENKFKEIKVKLKAELVSLNEVLNIWKQIQSKSKIQSSLKVSVPSIDVENIKNINVAIEELNKAVKIRRDIKSDMRSIEEEYQAKVKEEQLALYSSLRKDFKGKRSKLLILNSELNISEEWDLPSSDSKNLIKINSGIKQQIKKMNQKIKEREELLKNKKEEAVKKRQEFTKQIDDTVNKLNLNLRKLKLPEYPKQIPKSGQEISMLKKFKKELDKRMQEVKKQEILEKSRAVENQKKWQSLKDELNETNKILKLPLNTDAYEKKKFEQDIKKFELLISKNSKKITDIREKENNIIIGNLNKTRKAKLEMLKNLESDIKNTHKKIQAIQKQIGVDEEAFGGFPWEKGEILKGLTGYYPFEEKSRLILPGSPAGEILEFKNWTEKISDQGRYNLGARLNGRNQYALLPLKEKGDGDYLSVLFWIKPVVLDGKQGIFQLARNIELKEYIALTLEGSSLFVESKEEDEKKSVDTGLLLSKGEWQHLSLVFQRKYRRVFIYINGQLQWNQRVSHIPETFSRVVFGGIQNDDRYLNGIFDELKLYSRLLTDDELAKSGIEDNFISLSSRIKLLESLKSSKTKLLNSKQAEFNKMIEKKKELEEQINKQFNERLEELNSYHEKLGEPKENIQDFDAFDEEYRFTIIKSRIRRAKRRYQTMVEQLEAERKTILEQIGNERTKLGSLYKKLGIQGDLFDNVPKGQEEKILNEIKAAILNREAEYQKKIKNRREHLEYIKNEMKKVGLEIGKVCKVLKIPPPKIPVLKKGEEEKILSDYRGLLTKLQEQLNLKIAQEKKKFAEDSAEIEKIWEQLIPVLQELNEEAKKPQYNIKNAEKVLIKLKSSYDRMKKELKDKKEKEKKLYEKAKKDLESLFNELKDLFVKVGEPVSFTPNYEKNLIFKSLSQCRDILNQKKQELKAQIEREKREQVRILNRLLDTYHEKFFQLENLNNSLKIPLKKTYIDIIQKDESYPDKYFKFAYLFKNQTFDIEHELKVDISKAQIQKVENKEFSNSVLFNGQSSFFDVKFKETLNNNFPLSISFYMKPHRFWKNKSIVFLESEKQGSGLDVFLDRNEIKVRQLINGKFTALTSKISVIHNEWCHIFIKYNKKEKIIQFFKNGKPLPVDRLKSEFTFNGTVRFGSYNSKNDFYQGEIAELKIFNNKKFELKEVKNTQRVIIPEYKIDAKSMLEQKIKSIEELIKTRSLELQKLKKQEEAERNKILEEIEALKKELGKLTNQEKVIFSVVIGEEKKALSKLKSMVEKARKEFERKQKEEKLKLEKLKNEIAKKQNVINNLIQELGKSEPAIQMKEGKELSYLKALNTQIQELNAEMKIKQAKNTELTKELENLHKKLGTETANIPVVSTKLSVINANKFLLNEIKNAEQLFKLRAGKELLEKWKIQHKKYNSIMSEIGVKPEKIEVPSQGKELEALSVMSDKIAEAKKKLKEFNLLNAERLVKEQSRFNIIMGQLKPMLRELGQAEIELKFNAEDTEQSLKDAEELLRKKQAEVTAKRNEEEKRVQMLKETTEGLSKAIEESKLKIKQYVKELSIKDYVLPTALMDVKGLKDLKVYFKFDALKDKKIVDDTGNSKESFFTNFTEEVKAVGKFGFAADLNGLDQFISIDIPDEISQAEEVSFAFWIYPTRTYGKRLLLCGLNDKKKSGFSLFIEDGSYGCLFFKGAQENKISTNQSVGRKVWAHITLTLSKNGNVALYINSQKVGSTVLKASYSDYFTSNLVLGSDFKSLLNLFSGKVDEYKMFGASLMVNEIKNIMEEQVFKSKVTDIELLKEEYTLLQDESRRLFRLIEEKMQEEEEIRLKKVQKINGLKDQISEIYEAMGLVSFQFSHETGKESKAIARLEEILEEKKVDLKEYEKKAAVKEEQFKNRASDLEKEIRAVQQKLGVKKVYKVELKKGLEEEILKDAQQYLININDDYNDFIKKQKEEDLAKMRKEIFTRISKINDQLEVLGQERFELPDSWSGEEEIMLQKIKAKEEEIALLLKAKHMQELADKEIALKNILTKKYRAITRDIESLQRDLNIIETKTVTKKDDPSARIYLNFNEGRGTLVQDRTVYGNQGKFLDDDFEWSQNGIYNGAVNFKEEGGTMVIYEAPSLSEIESFTTLFWVRSSELKKSSRLFSIGKLPNCKLSLMVQNGRLIVGMGKDLLVDAGVNVKEDIWQHFALIFDKSKNQIFVHSDGTLVSQIDYPDKFSKYSILLNNPIYVGAQTEGENFSGLMDEFKLFARVLTPDEIKENKKEGIPKIDTTIENYTPDQIETLIVTLEEKREALDRQKITKDKQELAKRKQLIIENKILREAETKKNLKRFELLVYEIKEMRKKLGLQPKDFEFPDVQEEIKVINNLSQMYNDLKGQIRKDMYVPSMIKKVPSTKIYDKEENIFCQLFFDNIEGSVIPDNSITNQDIQFTVNTKDYIEKQGLVNQAIRIGDHGYIKITNNQKVPYNLRQAFQLWIKPDANSSLKAPIIKRGDFTLELKDGYLRFLIGDEVITFEKLGKIKDLKWTKINFVLDQFASKIQIGLGKNHGIAKEFHSRVVNSDGTIYIGGSPERADRFSGLLDEVNVFHRILYFEDFTFPAIYNVDFKGTFTRSSPHNVLLDLNAENAEFMRIYQEGKISESRWEYFRNQKILPVLKDKVRKTKIMIIAELKNRYTDKVREVKLEIPLPALQDMEIILPPKNSKLTSR